MRKKMCEILYVIDEGGCWQLCILDGQSEEDIMKLCESQSKDCIDPYHTVLLPNGLKVTAVMFHNGLIWDTILSAYARATNKYPSRRLSKCYKFRYEKDKKWCG